MCENLLRSYKTGLVPPINFNRTRIKELVTITRSSSNVLIKKLFLFFFFCVVSCWLHASGAFFACCRTSKVLILTPDYQGSVSSKIFHLQLKAVHFKKLCMPDEKSSKYAWEPRNGDSGRHKPYRYVPPHRVGFLRRFGLKTGIHFAHFGLESGMVFEGTT